MCIFIIYTYYIYIYYIYLLISVSKWTRLLYRKAKDTWRESSRKENLHQRDISNPKVSVTDASKERLSSPPLFYGLRSWYAFNFPHWQK